MENFNPTPDQLQAAADYYQQVHDTRARIDSRTKTFESQMARFHQLRRQQNEVVEQLINLSTENMMDDLWLKNAVPPFAKEDEAKIVALLIPTPNTAA